MNIIVNTTEYASNEIFELASVANWFISLGNSAPMMGQVDDSIIGSFEMTRSSVKLDKYHAMICFQNATHYPDFSDGDETTLYSGREVMSKILEETPINFTSGTEYFQESMAQWIKYDPTETKVVIDQGKLISGVLDKKTVGKGKANGLYHLIYNDYGADRALDTMFDMQQVVIDFIYQRGYTIGTMDLLISRDAKNEIDRIASDIINKSRVLTDKLNRGEIIPPIGKTVEEFYEDQQINILQVFDDFKDPILKAIDHEHNNLFKLVVSGSKGSMSNVYNMISSIGQKLINGERIRQKFGYKRTLAYYPRFDTSPESRGYISNSYINGMNSAEYVFNSMNSRFDLITKALSTSVTGDQNRKSVKNLESIIINNLRSATKGMNIIQAVYGEDYLDPRKVIRVKFPTVSISDAEFAKFKYSDEKPFSDEFGRLAADREKYRTIFLSIEKGNFKNLMTDSMMVPVDVDRLLNDALREYGAAAVDKQVLADMVKTVAEFCERLPYVFINEIQERKRAPVPAYVVAAAWPMQMLTRSVLCAARLASKKVTPEILNVVLDRVRIRYSGALIEPGTAAGIISAQSFSSPLTQHMLDAHQRSASGGTNKGGMTKAKEILGARDVDALVSPTVMIPLKPEYSSQSKAQEIANNIEMMKLEQFVTSWQVFFEKYGAPVHPKYVNEKSIFTEFAKYNPLLTPPGDLIKWCIRFELSKTTMIIKSMGLDLIINRLREAFPETFIVYTPENARQIVIRVYMRNSMFKGNVDTAAVVGIKDGLLSVIIRGINGIINTKVTEMVRNHIAEDGSIKQVSGVYGIVTDGTNLVDIFANPYVDEFGVNTDAIMEVAEVLGIEAARQRIMSEMRSLVDACNHRHYMMYADEMTYNGSVTAVERGGLSVREASNVLLRIGFSSPIQTLEEAGINAMEDTIVGVTAPLLVGSVPTLGTIYDQFHADEEVIKANIKTAEEYLSAL